MATENKKSPDELGALWVRAGKDGKYFTGNITINDVVYPIVCFPNDRKKNDKQPDWRILKSRPKNAEEGTW